ncbi:MAG: glycosyltransferase family 2 protein [Candidatus Omnitrophota bacterium]
MNICIIIPTYNESRAIGELIKSIKKLGLDVVVVDDGSDDNTSEIARSGGAHVIAHDKNMGKGASLKMGFKHAIENGYDAVVVMDGDGQHDPDDIGRFVSAAESTGADLIVGNRMKDQSTMPFIRRLTNRRLSSFISDICGCDIPDTQCGFRFIRSRVLQNIDLISSKFETESEILIRAGKHKFKIDSIPVKTIYKGEVSAINPVKDALRFIRLILALKFERLTKRI